MNLKTLQSIISHGETETVEYKKSIAELDKLGKALCGQLNGKGGYGFIGITDKGNILGTEVTDSTKKKLSVFMNYFDPWPSIQIDYVSLPDTTKQVIVLCCQASPEDGPSTYRGRAYIKTPSGIQSMPIEQYKQRLLEHAGLSKVWETLPAHHFSIDDLDHQEIKKTFEQGIQASRIPEDEYTEDVEEILTHFDLIQQGTINHAAMVLFAKKMPADYPQCFIRMGRFVDETMDEVIDSQQLRGNAFQILNAAIAFFKRHLNVSSRYDENNLERIDEWAIPFLAMREAIINAICHRDYSRKEGDISLYIFHEALEIHNIGHLYGGLTIEQLLLKHPSRRRNERIAQVFHARKLIDRFGGGTRRMVRLCQAQQLPTPIFSEESDGFQVKFLFQSPIGAMPSKTDPYGLLNDTQKAMMALLKQHGALSTKALHEKLESPPSERRLRDQLNQLMERKLIEATGATNKRKWQLK